MIIVAIRTRTILVAGAAAVAALALSGCGADPSDAPAEHKSFALSGKTLTVDSDNASIELVPADVKTVEVTRRVDGWVFLGSGPHASWSMKNDKLTLRLKCDALASDCAARHQIKVPRGVTVVVQDDNGRITATGFTTPLKLRSDNGAVVVRDSAGALDLSSNNGSVNAENVSSGSVTAGSDNGAVRLAFSKAPDRVKTVSDNGAVEIALPTGTGLAYRVDTSSDHGRVKISVPRNDSSTHVVSARSGNGEVTVRSAN
ncbi:DUF4097 family beta strand repeat-containing protein [Streptomyces sp. NBC_00344]|uniref:DUF4097 family beta strand repeat-containing protein n=1 Tax=Streptomyces sp. NBC_00344 TaxID=2975720 RepID=UPI002E1DE262